ncbi:PAS domain-containing sensor histidine kinase [Methanobacterium sp. ACI-7]|uniref:PAS domain-containing sensor histidine kinase n=1 Tax=unclassified Methanobacterium TaxID=2627676 RepID=UPI0039C293D2
MGSNNLFSLKESEYFQIFENMEEEIHVYELVRDKNSNVIDLIYKYINPASKLNSGNSREEIVNKKLSGIYKSTNAIAVELDTANEVIKENKNKKFEIYFEHLDKYYSISAFSINELYVTLRTDITKQKEAEDTAKIQSDILCQVKDAVIAVDNENRITYWNKGAENLFGYTLEEVNDKVFPELVNYRWLNPEDRKKAQRQLKTIGEWHGENLTTKKSGEDVFIKSSVTAFKDDNGNFIGTVSIVRDISGPTNVEKALEENYRRLQEAQRVGKIGNWEWDIKSNVITISDGLYRIYGIDPGQFVKYETILNRVLPEYQQLISNKLEKALSDHSSFQYEIKICREDGNVRIILCQGEVVTDFAGHPLKIICVEQDVTERKEIEHELRKAKNELESTVERRTRELNQANVLLKNELEQKKIAETKLKENELELKDMVEELKRSNEELQQFAYVTSHDLQEPLRTISSFTQLLERRYKDQLDEDADEFMGYIVDASTRMQNLIKDLLEYSRVTTRGKEFELVDTNEVLQKSISNLHAAIEESNADVSYKKLPKVMADDRQMGQLFQNLISNAIKFKKHNINPKVTISCKQDEGRGEYIFSVSDNGIGIEPQYFDRIFTIFQRLHTRDEYPGTGIGLSISKRIIERHGGKMWLESEPDKGTTFYFTINTSIEDGENIENDKISKEEKHEHINNFFRINAKKEK